MIEWVYFPRDKRITPLGQQVVRAFENVASLIDSEQNNHLISADYKDSSSDVVLQRVRDDLEKIGFKVEIDKMAKNKISVPVLFGKMGCPSQSFEADAYHEKDGFIVEVEAGRAVANYQFLKDLFEASVMVDINYLAIAVRRLYKTQRDFDKCHLFLDTLYASDRLKLPLQGMLLIGY